MLDYGSEPLTWIIQVGIQVDKVWKTVNMMLSLIPEDFGNDLPCCWMQALKKNPNISLPDLRRWIFSFFPGGFGNLEDSRVGLNDSCKYQKDSKKDKKLFMILPEVFLCFAIFFTFPGVMSPLHRKQQRSYWAHREIGLLKIFCWDENHRLSPCFTHFSKWSKKIRIKMRRF